MTTQPCIDCAHYRETGYTARPECALTQHVDPVTGEVTMESCNMVRAQVTANATPKGQPIDFRQPADCPDFEPVDPGPLEVVAYGADNTGATDSAAAFQAAVDDAIDKAQAEARQPADERVIDAVEQDGGIKGEADCYDAGHARAWLAGGRRVGRLPRDPVLLQPADCPDFEPSEPGPLEVVDAEPTEARQPADERVIDAVEQDGGSPWGSDLT